MSGEMRFCRAADTDDPKRLIVRVLSGVHEAGNPYFDYLFGGSDSARSALQRWMNRSSSEVWICSTAILLRQEAVVGGFIAFDGSELRKRRQADTMALLMEARRGERAAIRTRLEAAAGLFAVVDPQEFYLSKMWIDKAFRGAGHAKTLMERYLSSGRDHGCSRFCLDVSQGNSAAIRLYESFGFRITGDREAPETNLHYVSMTADLTSVFS